MKLIVPLLLAATAFAQDGQVVNVSGGSFPLGYTTVIEDATNPTYICKAVSYDGARVKNVVAISAVSKASPASVTSTGHGIFAASRPMVTIAGATGTGWTTMNAAFIATVTGANTFTLATINAAGTIAAFDSSGFGTLGGTVTFTTTGPRTTVPEWAVMVLHYGAVATTSPDWIGWLGGSSRYIAPSDNFSHKCSLGGGTTNNRQ